MGQVVLKENNDIQETIMKYYSEIKRDTNGRYRSWEHCYKYFVDNRHFNNEEIIDNMCLHLAFYLASWGMYRGSAFLLQKDYKVHYEVVKEILDLKYERLWNAECEELRDEQVLNLIFELRNKIEKIYIEKRRDLDGKNNISETLVTKILMGTIGCVPAYDRYFIAGIRKVNIEPKKFNKKSMKALIEFYLKNKGEIDKCYEDILLNGTKYTKMKLIDMYFWQKGIDIND